MKRSNLTMTIQDVAKLFRDYGIPIELRRLSDGIASGDYPFGRVVRTSPNGRRTFEIWRVDVEAFLQISTKKGMKVLTDPRDIYELVANQGARRKRACILNIIPGDVTELAVDRCNKTLQNGNKNLPPLLDRLRDLTGLMQKYYSIPLKSIEKYFGYPLDVFTEMNFRDLLGIYNALREGAVKREDYFQLPEVSSAEDDAQPTSDIPDTKKNKNNRSTANQVSINDL